MESTAKMRIVLLASEWGSKFGGLSTLNRELAIQLAKHPEVQVSILLPRFNQEEKEAARNNNITLVQATEMPGYDEIYWLCSPPDDLQIDFIIGHGVVLGRPAQLIKRNRQCKWIQFVHTDPEELGMSKDYPDAVSKGEKKHQEEVKLCSMADFVVAVGPKLAEAFRSYLRFCKKDENVVELTPGIFSEFSNVVQSLQEGKKCRVLAFGRGDAEDFHLKGFDIAAKAVAKLNYAHLVFVGAPNKQQEEVAVRLKECSLPPSRLRVRAYKEIREDLIQLFSEVDLVIMPSRTEGFGLAALEALSAGLPVLVGANSGFGEALSNVPFGQGCVISSEDVEVWADEIGKVWEKDRAVRLQESKFILENYAKMYNWEEQSRGLLEKMRAIRNDQPVSKLKRKSTSSHTAAVQIAGPSASSSSTTEKRKGESSFAGPSAKKQRLTLKKKGTSSSTTSSKGKKQPEASGESATKRKTLLRAGSVKSEQPVAPTARIAAMIKDGTPSKDKLEELSMELGDSWEAVARRLKFIDAQITAFRKNNDEYAKQALAMLFQWKKRNGSGATYRVLHNALCHKFVNRKDLAEKFCNKKK